MSDPFTSFSVCLDAVLYLIFNIDGRIVTNDWFTGLVPGYIRAGAFGTTFNGTTLFHLVVCSCAITKRNDTDLLLSTTSKRLTKVAFSPLHRMMICHTFIPFPATG